MRETWERKRPLTGWDSKLTWIKSGSRSKVYDTPYEIHQKRFGPTQLSDPGINATIALDLTSQIGAKTTHIPTEALVEVTLTTAVGKTLNSIKDARKAYRTRNKVATFHSSRYQLMDLTDLTNNLMKILDKAAQHPSNPVWLVMAQVTLRPDEGQEDVVKKPRNSIHRCDINGKMVIC